MNNEYYYAYSDFLKKHYNEKVYKLPVQIPAGCPNREDRAGCVFCAENGTGFEAEENYGSVTEQLLSLRKKIEARYNAHKFIAYFQNYTNTYLPFSDFCSYVREAAEVPDIVEIAISTRPDCVADDHLEFLKKIEEEYHVKITVELGLQTVNYKTLRAMNRGHGLAEFLDCAIRIKKYGFFLCVHVILNLPGDEAEDSAETAKVLSAMQVDIVKIHSLYVARNSLLYDWFKDGRITICTKEEYIKRLILFLEFLSPEIAVERLFSRIPEQDAAFSNWNTSWWKLKDELTDRMQELSTRQGAQFHYLGGAALPPGFLTKGEKH